MLFTLHKSNELLRAGLAAGAVGYLLKSDGEDDLIEALETASRGEIYVTRAISPSVVANIAKNTRRSTGVGADLRPDARLAKAQ